MDAGIKVDPGERVYEEGVQKGYFCTNVQGGLFRGGVWPGMTHFPDFLNPAARRWFGLQYRFYTDMGIEGFWNDMNEPALFYTEYTKGPKRMEQILNFIFPRLRREARDRGAIRDYHYIFHQVDGKRIPHYRTWVAEKLGFLGTTINEEANSVRGQEIEISTEDSALKLLVLPTDEELLIAQDTYELAK